MKKSNLCSSALLWVLVLTTGYAQAQAPTPQDHPGKAVKEKAKGNANSSLFNLPSESMSLMFSFGAGSQLSKPPGGLPGWVDAKIKGAGTPGSIPVFTGGSNIGDSVITQTSGGISVNGIIQTGGGIRFPDGSTQTTAASGGGGGGGGGLTLPFEGIASSTLSAFSAQNTGGGPGVFGRSTSFAGVLGQSASGAGVQGFSSSERGVAGVSASGNGVDGSSTSGSGVFGGSTTGAGVRGESLHSEGVVGSSQNSVGVFGKSIIGPGVFGESNNGGTGVSGRAGNGGIGVIGQSGTGGIGVVGQTAEAPVVTANDRAGVVGASNNDFGVRGRSINFSGVSGSSVGGNGVVADSIANFAALFASNSSSAGINSHGVSAVSRTGVAVRGESLGSGLAAQFVGNVQVTGNLSKGGGSFKIDHPLDPENKYLYHSFVESPDMMNIYNGNIITDENGDASVILPDYFDALNQDFRYQLTVIGTFAQAIVATEVDNNRFTIRTSGANVKVSWQVTGVRKDPYAKKHRIPVEEDKAEQERGYYLHPAAYGQPEDRSVEWAKEPEETKQIRKVLIDSGVSPKSVPPPGSGALIVPERSTKQ